MPDRLKTHNPVTITLTAMLAGLLLCPGTQAAENRHSVAQQGAIADTLYYRIGGGSVITPALTRHNTQLLNVQAGWNADLMCGNFDIRTTVRNQLNGITDGFQDLMGEVIHNATSAVASLPAMVIQRANPQLYDLLTNGVLQGRLDFDKSQLSCQKMAEKMTDFAYNAAWTQSAKAENYQVIAATQTDAVRADRQAQKEAASKGKTWAGGQKRGGKGQPPVKLIADTTTAGYNLLNQRPVTQTDTIPAAQCRGEICRVWKSPQQAAAWMTRVAGEQIINVAPDNDTSASTAQRSGTKAGVGLSPLIAEEQEKIAKLLSELVSGSLKPDQTNLAKASGGSLLLTRGVVEALRDEEDAPVLIQRLAGEMALVRVMEQALMARRTLLAGMREPNIAAEKAAQEQLTQTASQLDQELSQLRLELEIRRMLADNATSLILSRRAQQEISRGQAVSVEDDGNRRVRDLGRSSAREK